jgi:FAD/FMN-containing dehydrogenase
MMIDDIKKFGKGNNNYLSFPNKSYIITLDSKVNNKLKKVNQEFEYLLINHKAKIYLTKDSFISAQYFKKTYGNYSKLKKIKNKYDPLNLINSFQSHRIGI